MTCRPTWFVSSILGYQILVSGASNTGLSLIKQEKLFGYQLVVELYRICFFPIPLTSSSHVRVLQVGSP
jgi:hypothetical protein